MRRAVALVTAWAAGETDVWELLAREAVDDGPFDALGHLSHFGAQLARCHHHRCRMVAGNGVATPRVRT